MNTTVVDRRSATFQSWKAMRTRCDNPNSSKYQDYGGRGITYTPSWLSFTAFRQDMGERPPGTTLGRIDNDGPYCKDNCEWQTPRQQSTNKRQYKSNKTGVTGVHAVRGRWLAVGSRNGKQQQLYWGKSYILAVQARQEWENATTI